MLGVVLGGLVLLLGCAALIGLRASGNQQGAEEGTETNSDGSGGGNRPKGKARAYSFSGKGTKNLGTIHVAAPSTLRWTHHSFGGGKGSFAINDGGFRLTVSSLARSGSSQVATGTYRGVGVQADGSWTVKITPNK
jgi:hypothetical protein